MNDLFEYDVFISFSSSDEELVRPLWQELCLSGIRVFWSDITLRDRVGASWFDIIQSSLDRSRHFILICTPASLKSEWVKREYVAFYSHCYRAPSRRLIPILADGCTAADLPLFLRELEACRIAEAETVKRLIGLLGGTDIETLRRELSKKTEEIEVLNETINTLRSEIDVLKREKAEFGKPTKDRTNNPLHPLEERNHKLFLRKSWCLSSTPGGREMEPQYIVGTEFEDAGMEENKYIAVKISSGVIRWLRRDLVSIEDRRAFFTIKNRGLTGYLVGHMTEQGLDGTVEYIVLQDCIVGKVHVDTKTIKSIHVQQLDKSAIFHVETFDGMRYSGISRESNHWGTYLICGKTAVFLDTAQDITLEAVALNPFTSTHLQQRSA